MNISKISAVNFGNYNSSQHPMIGVPNFNELKTDEKLNVMYGMLRDVLVNQEYNSEVISANQTSMQHANKSSFKILAERQNQLSKPKVELINDVFERNRVGYLPTIHINR